MGLHDYYSTTIYISNSLVLKDVSVELNCNVGFINGIFWNKHGACSKADHLEVFARNENIDVIFIAEHCLSSREFVLFDIPTSL